MANSVAKASARRGEVAGILLQDQSIIEPSLLRATQAMETLLPIREASKLILIHPLEGGDQWEAQGSLHLETEANTEW